MKDFASLTDKDTTEVEDLADTEEQDTTEFQEEEEPNQEDMEVETGLDYWRKYWKSIMMAEGKIHIDWLAGNL